MTQGLLFKFYHTVVKHNFKTATVFMNEIAVQKTIQF